MKKFIGLLLILLLIIISCQTSPVVVEEYPTLKDIPPDIPLTEFLERITLYHNDTQRWYADLINELKRAKVKYKEVK